MKAIIATNNLNFIGSQGKLPWDCPEDLEHFKKLTMGGKCLVGYNTAKTLPNLPGREVVVDDDTKTIKYKEIDWCIGGKSTYERHAKKFTEIHISHIDDYSFGDTVFPTLKLNLEKCKVFHYYFCKKP